MWHYLKYSYTVPSTMGSKVQLIVNDYIICIGLINCTSTHNCSSYIFRSIKNVILKLVQFILILLFIDNLKVTVNGRTKESQCKEYIESLGQNWQNKTS